MTNLEKIMEKINIKVIIATIASEVANCRACPIKEFCEKCDTIVCQTVWKRWLESEATKNV